MIVLMSLMYAALCRPTGASTAGAAQRGAAAPVGIPALSASRSSSAAGGAVRARQTASPATDTAAAEIKQALAFTTADTGVHMRRGWAASFPLCAAFDPLVSQAAALVDILQPSSSRC